MYQNPHRAPRITNEITGAKSNKKKLSAAGRNTEIIEPKTTSATEIQNQKKLY